jgi:hypothetical protein
MCVVIDTNVFGAVFETDSKPHAEFAPVLDWVTAGPGFVVYGGTKYKRELNNATKYLPVFVELKKSNRLKEVNCKLVDSHQHAVESLVGDACNDPHIIAIFRVSGCRVFCSNDKQADEHIKNKDLYLDGQKPPSIYRSSKHKRLLCAKNIVAIQNCV